VPFACHGGSDGFGGKVANSRHPPPHIAHVLRKLSPPHAKIRDACDESDRGERASGSIGRAIVRLHPAATSALAANVVGVLRFLLLDWSMAAKLSSDASLSPRAVSAT
jgi:hypothetical protein